MGVASMTPIGLQTTVFAASNYKRPEVTIFGQSDLVTKETMQVVVEAPCQSQGSHAPMQTLFYHLFYLKWDHNLQNKVKAMGICIAPLNNQAPHRALNKT